MGLGLGLSWRGHSSIHSKEFSICLQICQFHCESRVQHAHTTELNPSESILDTEIRL